MLKILTKKKAGFQLPEKIQKRVANISTPDLVTWVEASLFEIGRTITHHQRDRNVDALDEMELASQALLAIVQELKKRANNER